jgi:hypothetical protein
MSTKTSQSPVPGRARRVRTGGAKTPRKRPEQWRAKRYVITRAALDEARRLLGIVAPIEIRLTSYKDATFGRLIAYRDGVWIIGLDTYLSARQASITLWHELVHVAQAQRAGGIEQFHELVWDEAQAARLVGPRERRFLWSRAYRRMPHEREAERRGRQGHRRARLARRRRD